jgi:carbamoyl-phosphate synthase small subunit
MSKKAYLILENGKVFEGYSFGKPATQTGTIGEIVFTTGMGSYLETLTDPSYYGQMILQTFPLIGNYGVIPADFESGGGQRTSRCHSNSALRNRYISAKAYIVKHPCQNPSNFRNEGTLDTFLREQNIVGIHGIDTRALTKLIRENGVMNGCISSEPTTDLSEIKAYKVINAVAAVSSKEITKEGSDNSKYRIALMDFGSKRGIASELLSRDCQVITFPYNTPAEEILKCKPHGIMLSNGSGDPATPENASIIEELRNIIQVKPSVTIFGICLGHQLLAMANGYMTRKLRFGHRGANQPVKDLATGRVYITSQNHGYEVMGGEPPQASRATPGGVQLPGKFSFINVNDNSCEGVGLCKFVYCTIPPRSTGRPDRY